jgi:dihydroflavonol-4-reductase
MTVLVTGASGHIGANLIRILLTQGYQVRALVHSDIEGISGLDVEQVKGDVHQQNDVLVACVGIDVVYHLASYVSIQKGDGNRLQAINVNGTRNIITACHLNKIRRLVHFSSIHAFQKDPLNQVLDENRALVNIDGISNYEQSKAASENLVRQAVNDGLDAVIVNPTAVIGPYDYKPSHIGQVLISLARRHLPALVEGGFDWVDSRDVALAAIIAAEVAPAGARYLLSGHWVSVLDLARVFEKLTGISAPSFVCPMGLAKTFVPLGEFFSRLVGSRSVYTSMSLEVLNSHRNISHARATSDLDYHPRPFSTTIADTLQWFIDHQRISCKLKPDVSLSHD